MATVQYNVPSSLTIDYAGGIGRITLLPGINLNIPDEEWNLAEKHPFVLTLLEIGKIEILSRSPLVTSELEGIAVVDNRKTDEPMPVQNAVVGGIKPDPLPIAPRDEDEPSLNQGIIKASIDAKPNRGKRTK